MGINLGDLCTGIYGDVMWTNVSSPSRAEERQVKSGNGFARVRVLAWIPFHVRLHIGG